MTDLELSELGLRVAYVGWVIHHQQANARYACASEENRAEIAKVNAKARAVVDRQVAEAEAKLKYVMSIESQNVNIS